MDTIDMTPKLTIPDKKELRQKIDQLNLAYDLAFSILSSLEVDKFCVEALTLPGVKGDQIYRVRVANAFKELQSTLYDLQAHIGIELSGLTSTLDIMEGVQPGGNDDR